MTESDFKELGELLRTKREEQSLSLQEVESQTRIRAKFIEALENGDVSILPSPTHAKGFLRNYAQFLQLDADAIVMRFAELTGTAPVTKTVSTVPPKPSAPAPTPAIKQKQSSPQRQQAYIPPSQRQGPGRPAGMQEALEQAPAQTEAKVQPPQTQKPEERGFVSRMLGSTVFTVAIIVVGMIATAWWATSKLSGVSGSDLIPETQPADQSTNATSAEMTVTPSPTFRLTSTPTDLPLEIYDRVVLSVIVTQTSWTRITVDGFVVFEGQPEIGTELLYEAHDEVFIRTGNGAGLTIRFNGRELGAMGEYGQLVERFYTVTGPVTPTPTPTVTPTPTSVPSATPSPTP